MGVLAVVTAGTAVGVTRDVTASSPAVDRAGQRPGDGPAHHHDHRTAGGGAGHRTVGGSAGRRTDRRTDGSAASLPAATLGPPIGGFTAIGDSVLVGAPALSARLAGA